MAPSLMVGSVYLEKMLNCLEKSVCPTPTQQKLPETWEQPPHTHSHPSTASLTTGAFALAIPGEVTVWAPSWRNQIPRTYWVRHILCPTPIQPGFKDLGAVFPHPQLIPITSLTTEALVLTAPGEASVWVPKWRALLSRL